MTQTGDMSSGSTVRAQAVSKVLGPTALLAPTDMTADPGTCAVVRGVNGSGKTTLLRLIAGLWEPTSGLVTIDDRVADERDPVLRSQVATLIGAPAAYRDLTLTDHLTLIDATWGRDPDTCAQRVADQLADLEIDHLGERFPHELSSGQGQLFRLSLVLFRPGSLIILDEPEQRLDTEKRVLIGDLLAERRDAGVTLVVACHDPDLTERIADGIHTLAAAE